MDPPRETVRRVGSGLARWVRRGLARRSLPRAERFWATLELPSPVLDVPLRHWGRDGITSLLGLLEALEAVAEDPRVPGLALRVGGPPGGLAKALALRRALDAVRARGKRVVAWAESLDLESLYVASAADRLWIPETGRVVALGLRADGFYLRDLLARIDVKPEVVRVGTHKSAAEMLTNDRMSDAQREQLEAILGDTFDVLVEGIATGRGLDPTAVRERIDRGLFGAPAAREAGLVDDLVYRDALEERLEREAARESALPSAAEWMDARVLANARDAGGARAWIAGPPRIAYVFASGAIGRGRGGRGIASREFEERLGRIAEDRRVRGVVLRIDSPGGDALASDLLWRAVRVLRREKPVIASLAEVAASGGYYLASAADRVLAEAATITGSIGVIGGKLDLSGLYRRLGVGVDAVEVGDRAGLHSSARGFTAAEREAVGGEMRELYATFLARVAEGRGLAVDAVERVAEGRVFTGRRALAHGLVDTLGGPLEALREVRQRAGLRATEPVVLDLHPRLPRFAALRALSRWLSP
jgi:protease IV